MPEGESRPPINWVVALSRKKREYKVVLVYLYIEEHKEERWTIPGDELNPQPSETTEEFLQRKVLEQTGAIISKPEPSSDEKDYYPNPNGPDHDTTTYSAIWEGGELLSNADDFTREEIEELGRNKFAWDHYDLALKYFPRREPKV